MKQVKFKIGQKFKTRGKQKHICTVTDIYKTYNSKNELVRVRYAAVHEFLGQQVTDHNVTETTIAMGKIN